nr:hypothetical protein [Tanacetum cinerariifolium]
MIRAQVGDLSSHSTKYSSPAITQKVFANMRRVGKGFFRVDTPLFEGMIVGQQADDVADEGDADVDVADVPAAAKPSIPSLTTTTQPPPPSQELPSTSQVIPNPPPSPIAHPPSPKQQPQPSHDAEVSMDLLHTLLETCTTLTRRESKDPLRRLRLKKMLRLKRMQMFKGEVVTIAATITNADTLITTDALTTASSAAKRRKGVVIRDPEETATPSIIIHSEPKSKDKGKGIMVEEPKPLKKQA